MHTIAKFTIGLLILGAASAASYDPIKKYWKDRNRLEWRTAKVTRGSIESVVNATGTIKPVLSVSVGSFASGPIIELCADFNDVVKKGDLLARIDPRLFEAIVAETKAILATREAEVERAKALLKQAQRDQQRAKAVYAQNKDFISQKEMDAFHFSTLSLQAQLKLAEAAVLQARAAVENATANLGYTEIRSPVDGMVIDCKIEEGQTLAAQFQTPELFIVAPEMEKKMRVFASVDEADIGLIRTAKEQGRRVTFQVDAYPDDLFEGTIEQIRKSSTETQGVVTYPVIVSAANPDLKLLPGMTANISFQVDKKDNIVRIPNAAFWFYPDNFRENVRAEDRKILDGAEEEKDDSIDTLLSAADRVEASRKRALRHVWTTDGEWLKAIAVETGLSDSHYHECVAGDISAGDELVLDLKSK
jgi:HlyD family secretion protein